MSKGSQGEPTVLDLLKELKEYIIVLALLASVVGYLAYNLHKLPESMWLLRILFWMAVPVILLLIYLYNLRPAMIRQRELRIRPTGDPTAEYFTTSPRTEADSALFNGKPEYEKILSWLMSTHEPVLMLTGQSGVGKSSLVDAYLAPELSKHSEPRIEVVRLRAGQDPLAELKGALSERLKASCSDADSMDPLQLVSALESSAPAGHRTLIVLDQFEEFFLLQGAVANADPVSAGKPIVHQPMVEELRDFFRRLLVLRPTRLSILLSYREDHQPMVDALELPARTERLNWMPVYPMSLASTRAFINACPGLNVPKERMDKVIAEAARYEDSQGIRPIVSNILGLVLLRMVDHPTAWRRTDDLLRYYVESGLGKELRLDRAKVLRSLLSDFRTATPHAVRKLASSTRWSVRTLENQLELLGHHGLLRCLNPAEPEPGERKWQIAHDFLALQVDRVMPGIHQTTFRAIRPWLAPTALLIVILLTSFIANSPEDRAARSLREVGLMWDPERRTIETSSYAEENLTSVKIHERKSDLVLLDPQAMSVYSEVLVDLEWLQGLQSLRSLDILGCNELKDLSGLQSAPSIVELDISLNTGIEELDGLQHLRGLRFFSMGYCPKLNGIDELSGLTSLRTLNLANNEWLRDLSMISGLDSLEQLRLGNCQHLTDFSGLQGLSRLDRLDLKRCARLKDLEALRGLISLRALDISFCDSLTDLSALTALPALDTLRLHGTWLFQMVDELPPLPGPRLIEVGACELPAGADTTGLRAKLPHMVVLPKPDR